MYRILVVDDERLVLNLLQEALTRCGYLVKTASTVHEAVHMFEEEPFDLVITDILMPDGDGTHVAQHIRGSQEPRVPIMGISGTPWLLKRDRFDKVLSKPFTLESLRDCVQELVTGRFSADGTAVNRKTAVGA